MKPVRILKAEYKPSRSKPSLFQSSSQFAPPEAGALLSFSISEESEVCKGSMTMEKIAAGNGGSHVERFRRIVLGWDYLRLLRESTRSLEERKAAASKLKSVKSTYQDMKEYLEIFEPLLLEEVKAQIVQAKDEEEVSDWKKAAVVTCDDLSDFHKVTVVVDETFPAVSENDLLVLSKDQFSEGMPPIAYAFGMVEFRANQTIKIVTFFSGERNENSEVESGRRLVNMLKILKTKQSIFFILKICSLSTIIREYIALHSLDALPFKNLILSATDKLKDGNFEDRSWNVSKSLMEFLETEHNESQINAIRVGLTRKPFVLIQGPPGTGKTQTILGLLSAVLHSAPERVQSRNGLCFMQGKPELSIYNKYSHWTKASPWLNDINPRDKIMPSDGDDGFFPTSGNELKPEVVSSNRKYRVHVLVCAPSNSALDEIVLRVLRTGIHDESGHLYNPKIVRIGLKPHHSVQAVSIDYLVDQKLTSMDRLSQCKDVTSGPMDRDRIRANILDEAAIVFSTLSFSGSTVFGRMNRVFDVVIIDEAAQAVEPATLVPLAHGCKQVFLVGDPVQLPATVISTVAEKHGYGTSLFKRFQKAGYPVHMLKTQYRMHPKIRSFPSKEFYSDSLEDGELVPRQTKRPWHDYRCFGPFCFFDIDGVESQPSGSGSWINEDEVEFILVLYHNLASRYPELKSSSQMAVISPYRHQVKLLRDKFNQTFGQRSNLVVDVNTVDGFQGREKDVAVFSCVRANSGKGIGFVSDFRRMNVGITRARSSVLVVGSASTLAQDKHWKNLINFAKAEDGYFKISKPYASFFGDANLKSLERESRESMMAKMAEKVAAAENAAFDGAMNEDQNGGVEEADGDADDGGGYDE